MPRVPSSPQSSQPTLDTFQELLHKHPDVFYPSRSAKALQLHWQLMKQYYLLDDQTGEAWGGPCPPPAPPRGHPLSSEPRKATRVCRHESMRRKCRNSGFTCLFGGGVSSATLRHRRGVRRGPLSQHPRAPYPAPCSLPRGC